MDERAAVLPEPAAADMPSGMTAAPREERSFSCELTTFAPRPEIAEALAGWARDAERLTLERLLDAEGLSGVRFDLQPAAGSTARRRSYRRDSHRGRPPGPLRWTFRDPVRGTNRCCLG